MWTSLLIIIGILIIVATMISDTLYDDDDTEQKDCDGLCSHK